MQAPQEVQAPRAVSVQAPRVARAPHEGWRPVQAPQEVRAPHGSAVVRAPQGVRAPHAHEVVRAPQGGAGAADESVP